MEQADAEIIAEFVVESQEGLAKVERQMLAIEAAGAGADLGLVNSVFRTMHSIKGTAGFLGLDRIGMLAHGLEEVLDHMRNREIDSSSELVSTVLCAADYMRSLIDAVETSNEADVDAHVSALNQFRPGAATPSVSVSALPGKEAGCRQTMREPYLAAETKAPAGEAVREFLIECYENLDQMDRDLLALEQDSTTTNLLRSVFRTMHTIKGGAGFLGLGRLEKLAHTSESLLGKLRDGALPLSADVISALLATVDKCREGLQLLESQGSDDRFDCEDVVQRLLMAENADRDSSSQAEATVVVTKPVETQQSVVSGPPVTSTPTAPTHVAKSTTDARAAPVTAEAAGAEKNGNAAGDSTIRVDVALLDKLMNGVGELVLARNQILQHSSRLEEAEFLSTAQRLNLITTELQEGVMKTRMQPIGNVWAKFPRVVRDLAAQLGKQVRIEMEGKETELDKTIVEAIKDPLTHLVRNSVDHGIEFPATRQAAGKQPEGRLLLRAYHEGGQVNIEITDDGAGLNLERVRKKAVQSGLLSTEQATRISDRDVSQLIFAPGFSTAEKVTNVSGRGVGMDVVRTNIERIGGTIDLQSRPGQGTTIKIKIPLTLAIIPALIVTNDGDRYAIPQVSLLELVRLDGAEANQSIEFVHGAPVYRLRGKLLPLIFLSESLQSCDKQRHRRKSSDGEAAVNIVVLRADDQHFGLVVDKVNDTEEIVVKPLGKQLKGIIEYAGATIMGDGAIALILDVKGLAVASGLGNEQRGRPSVAEVADQADAADCKATLLIVDLADSRRFALPTSTVARLEKLPASSVEEADAREVIQYRGGILPLVKLADVFGGATSNMKRDDILQVIVYDEQDWSFGLVVERIVDITEADLIFREKKQPDDYLLGTTVVQQRVTDVLNLRNLARFKSSRSVPTSKHS